MQAIVDFLISYGLFLFLICIGWIFGRLNEQDHLRALATTEKELGHIIVSSERFYQPTLATGVQGELVMGSVVIAQDYFKMVIAGILNFFGKNLTTYETLLDRARREAVVRMKYEAQFAGYNQVYGIRLEVTTLNVTGSMVEAIAYGTAVHSVGERQVPPPLPVG